MEALTKQQIVLVTLLVSFVTSIATGIVTVALMEQAPPGVTQTINRVVERTVEKVVPSDSQSQTAAVAATKETIVVKEDDLVVAAVAAAGKSLVAISFADQGAGPDKAVFAGNGLIISSDGLVIAPAGIIAPRLDPSGNQIPTDYFASLSDGSVFKLAIIGSDGTAGIAVLKAVPDASGALKSFTPAPLGDSDGLKLGQTVVSVGGESRSVGEGIISNFLRESGGESGATTTPAVAQKILLIRTDVAPVVESAGAALADLSGDVVGLKLGEPGSNSYAPIRSLKAAAAALTATTTASSASAR